MEKLEPVLEPVSCGIQWYSNKQLKRADHYTLHNHFI